MTRMIVLFIAILLSLFFFAPAYGQDKATSRLATGTVEGHVVEADWVGSSLVVKDVSDVRFITPEDVKVLKEDEEASIEDIEVGDRVTVRYYVDGSGRLVAEEITVEE